MKKYLIGGALALVAGLFVTSCTHDDGLYGTTDAVKQRTEEFQKAFTKAYGTIASNQTWGFDQTVEYEKDRNASTRTTVTNWDNADLHPDLVASKPTELTDQEKSDVTKFFRENKFNDEGENIDWSKYWVEFVSKEDTTTLTKDGAFFRANERFTFDQFSVDKPVTSGFDYEAVERWNANTHPLMYLENVGTKRFRIWLSYTSQWVYDYTIQKYNGEYYLGFDLYGDKQDNGHLELGMTSRGYYNDYIVRLVPGEGEGDSEPEITYEYEYGYIPDVVESTGRIFCEDLASNYSERADFDYNDAVFDATVISRTYYLKTTEYTDGVKTDEDITYNVIKPAGGADGDTQEQEPRYFAMIDLFAAGGTKPLSICGQEVHAVYNVGIATMVNTFDGNSKTHTSTDSEGRTSTAYGSYTFVENPIRLTNPNPPVMYTAEEENNTTYPKANLFELEVKKTEEGQKIIPKILDIPVIVQISVDGYEVATDLSAYRGTAPHMIKVPTNTRWPSERFDISEAYPGFTAYVGGGDAPWANPNPEATCMTTPSISNFSKGEGSPVTTSSGGVTEKVYYTNSEGYDISKGLYLFNNNLISGLSEGDRIRIHVTDVQSSYTLILSDGNSSRLGADQTQLAGKSSGYIDFGLSAYMIQSLISNGEKNTLILSGTGLKVTSIGIVKK